MDWALIASFDYEIRNKIDLELSRYKNGSQHDYWSNLKTYMLERIDNLQQEIKEKEDRLLKCS